jgi:hypothetical protein
VEKKKKKQKKKKKNKKLLLAFSTFRPAVICCLLLACCYLFPIPSILLRIGLILLAYFIRRKGASGALLCLFFKYYTE